MNPFGDRAEDLEYDSKSGTYRASYENATETPIIAVVEIIAALEETDPTALEPLGRTIDTDALNAVLHHSESSQTLTVSFTYRTYRVTVQSDGVIEVQPTDSGQGSPNTAG